MSSILWILPSLEHIPSSVIPLHCVLIFSAVFITITQSSMFIPVFRSLGYDLPDYVVHLYTPRVWYWSCSQKPGSAPCSFTLPILLLGRMSLLFSLSSHLVSRFWQRTLSFGDGLYSTTWASILKSFLKVATGYYNPLLFLYYWM